MARPQFRRKAAPSSDEGRFLASRIQDARRKGYTNKVIADSFGINERTVRKIVAGQTSGRKLYAEHVAPTRVPLPGGMSPNVVRLDLNLGNGPDGRPVVRTVNAKVGLVNGRTPTPFDILRYPKLAEIANAEAERMRRQYQGDTRVEIEEADEICQRSYCGHTADEHVGLANKYPCTICECPNFKAARAVIDTIRPILRRRDAHKRYVTLFGDA